MYDYYFMVLTKRVEMQFKVVIKIYVNREAARYITLALYNIIIWTNKMMNLLHCAYAHKK